MTPKTEYIQEVIPLGLSTKQTANYRKAAAKMCGAAVARASWALVVQFPEAAMASADQLAVFLVKTKHGWSLYGSIYVSI